MKSITDRIGKNGAYFLGCIAMIGGAICASLLKKNQTVVLFILPVLFGTGTSILLVQSLAIGAALIGENATSAAFFYGAMGITEKVISAGAVMLIQFLSPCEENVNSPEQCNENECALFYNKLLGLGIGVITLAALSLNTIVWFETEYGKKQLNQLKNSLKRVSTCS